MPGGVKTSDISDVVNVLDGGGWGIGKPFDIIGELDFFMHRLLRPKLCRAWLVVIPKWFAVS
jgi:hypothetical protein